jgi:hypothetical protein
MDPGFIGRLQNSDRERENSSEKANEETKAQTKDTWWDNGNSTRRNGERVEATSR